MDCGDKRRQASFPPGVRECARAGGERGSHPTGKGEKKIESNHDASRQRRSIGREFFAGEIDENDEKIGPD